MPGPGDPAPRIHTPTEADVGGDLAAIDTRLPPSSMHDADFADVVGKKPVVLLFATPQLCQSRVCGPVVDIAEQVEGRARGGRGVHPHGGLPRQQDRQGLSAAGRRLEAASPSRGCSRSTGTARSRRASRAPTARASCARRSTRRPASAPSAGTRSTSAARRRADSRARGATRSAPGDAVATAGVDEAGGLPMGSAAGLVDRDPEVDAVDDDAAGSRKTHSRRTRCGCHQNSRRAGGVPAATSWAVTDEARQRWAERISRETVGVRGRVAFPRVREVDRVAEAAGGEPARDPLIGELRPALRMLGRERRGDQGLHPAGDRVADLRQPERAALDAPSVDAGRPSRMPFRVSSRRSTTACPTRGRRRSPTLPACSTGWRTRSRGSRSDPIRVGTAGAALGGACQRRAGGPACPGRRNAPATRRGSSPRPPPPAREHRRERRRWKVSERHAQARECEAAHAPRLLALHGGTVQLASSLVTKSVIGSPSPVLSAPRGPGSPACARRCDIRAPGRSPRTRARRPPGP